MNRAVSINCVSWPSNRRGWARCRLPLKAQAEAGRRGVSSRPNASVPCPGFPQRIGLVTSPTGAALRDVLHAVRRRHPALQIIFVPCAVQGSGAAAEMADAIALLNQWSREPGRKLDAILLTRGGGSLEDLWAFNEESLARAIVQSAVPVVSAVGHEIDFTISDFTVGVRATTRPPGRRF